MSDDDFSPINESELEDIECEIVGGDTAGSGDYEQNESRAQAKGEFIGDEQCGKLCGALSELIASRKGDKYRLSEDEQKQLGEVLDPVLLKYMPQDAGDMSAELSLALVAFAIIVPRMGAGDEQ